MGGALAQLVVDAQQHQGELTVAPQLIAQVEWQGRVMNGITSLLALVSDPARVAALKRGHWQIENGLHYVKDVTLGEDASQTHVGYAADILAMIRNTAISLLRRAWYRAIAARLRHYSGCPHEALALIGIQVDENA